MDVSQCKRGVEQARGVVKGMACALIGVKRTLYVILPCLRDGGWVGEDEGTINTAGKEQCGHRAEIMEKCQTRQVNITFQIVACDCDRQVDGYLREHSTNDRLAAESESSQAE
ncbi:hypothetical protein FOYG_04970 [Fusarium oxysporum NRRL 32931]|uniref:Uncharacterized protein n=1 Tax=Fusarium oxysporum NRRL 32931 TaxID=660029 RepID=W9INB2_FUSOX|nr:hypothetical protein FOYG_04970 [Fusarium oxysporum NRRL 32931]